MVPAAKPSQLWRRSLDLVVKCSPVAEVACGCGLGISGSCWRRWMSIDYVDAGPTDGLTSSERQALVELRRRNRAWEMGIEVTERASAYFAREKALPQR